MDETNKVPGQTPGESIEELQALLRRAEQGDRAALASIRRVLDDHPEVWASYGDLAQQAEASLVQLVSGKNHLLSESLLRKLEALKAKLAGEAPSPLERLLAERVALCWLQLSYCDSLVSQMHDATTRQADELRRRQDGAHRRYLSALKALDSLRRHVKPAPARTTPATAAPGRPALPELLTGRLGRRGPGVRPAAELGAEN